MTPNIGQSLLVSLTNGLTAVVNFVPKFVAGVIIIFLGIIIASLLKQIVIELFKTLKIEQVLRKYGVPEGKQEFVWTNILAEIVRWFVFVLFLIPTADVWGLPQVAVILNTFLLYLPNVLVAAIIGLIGLAFARLAHDVVLASVQNLTTETAQTLASITRWAIVVFVLLAILNQLGVATDIIRILVTGFVAMIAIAGGIAFGLGGQNVAKEILENIKKKMK
ncbi:hypothetical protein C4559_02945 [Candidatus Microgenomates bacterium]|nr:MAG: hypothetical protein C4559_02945 [Candidatus Microgenomates bacterium]